ncbi:MAG: 3-methyl-2-oxobutanoate hydroxymethyltransferase [bacterium]
MEKITLKQIQAAKSKRQKMTMLTAYDHPFAKILDEAGVDIILIGDSLGNVALGYKNTLPVTMEEMVIHAKAVARGTRRALVVADMPFGSYQKNDEEAVGNAIKLIKAGVNAVKVEGSGYLPAIKKIIKAGIPVMGHLGFTPQSVNLIGCRVQGVGSREEKRLLKEAKELEKAGCFALVLELIPEKLASKITKSVKIPTFGIGAGNKTDGQVLVTNDLLGLNDWQPKFVKPEANLRQISFKAIKIFIYRSIG